MANSKICNICKHKFTENDFPVEIIINFNAKTFWQSVKRLFVMKYNEFVCMECLKKGINFSESKLYIHQDSVNRKFTEKAKLKRWTENENTKIKQMSNDDCTIGEMAKELKKSPQAIRGKLWQLHKKENE